DRDTIAVHQGFVQVAGTRVSILSDVSESSVDIDVDRARAAIAAIKAHAAVTDDPGVYALALLSERSAPGEAPPPDTPRDLAWAVRTDGAIELSWDGGGPQGTYYVLTRALPGARGFAVLGTTTSKRFTDETLPAGASGTRYAVTARHGDASAPGPVAEVRLGRPPIEDAKGGARDTAA
ncbi:MAG: hypothetical protein HRU13_06925, partial [Phycisphaerales bacterium]|nr:hypothetical protein [Phycisphaerales bacterium]